MQYTNAGSIPMQWCAWDETKIELVLPRFQNGRRRLESRFQNETKGGKIEVLRTSGSVVLERLR